MAPLEHMVMRLSSSLPDFDMPKKAACSPLHQGSAFDKSLHLPPLSKSTLKKHELRDFASAPIRILVSLAGILGMPFVLYRSFPASTMVGNLLFVETFWNGFLHFSSSYIAAICLVVSVCFGPKLSTTGRLVDDADSYKWDRLTNPKATRPLASRIKSFASTVDGLAIMIGFAIFLPQNLLGSASMLYPSWIWFPLGLNNYRVYRPSQMAPALEGLCLEQHIQDIELPRRSWFPCIFCDTVANERQRQRLPLCLPEKSWDILSAGTLSSYNVQDVKSVLKGIEYARQPSQGVAIAVLARDIRESILPFRQNVETLRRFIPNVAVVIFENDSVDGSREAIKQWAQEAEGYRVDLLECAEAQDCKLGKTHRDEGGKDFRTSKAVGDMDVFRQRVTDYIADSDEYKGYSHMLVLDIDLAVSISPFGILHSLGQHPDHPVASSGRQLLPFSFGTLHPPYDLSAFRPWATTENHFVLSWHESFCGLMPPGDRWRNACDALSPMLMIEMLRADYGYGDKHDFYRVESAFNGAVLYPLDQVRESEATYDAGEDGQRCEHIGFNLAMKKPMYVNRKWNFHLGPTLPGGPSGWRAHKMMKHITTTPRLLATVVIIQTVAVCFFCHCFVTIGALLLFPLLAPIFPGNGSNVRRFLSWHQKRTKRKDEDTLLKLV